MAISSGHQADIDSTMLENTVVPLVTRPLSVDRAADAPVEDQVSTISYLIIFTLFGTLARLGLQALTSYPNAPLIPTVIWANVGACYTIGFLTEWHRHYALPTSIFIGLTTGFCGSFSSFSAFTRDIFLALINRTTATGITPARNAGYSVLASIAIIYITISLCMTALAAGTHSVSLIRCTVIVSNLRSSTSPLTPGAVGPKTKRVIVLVLAASLWCASLLLTILISEPYQTPWRTNVLFSLVFAPPGTMLRYWISRRLNPGLKGFPRGTFAVNVIGSLLDAGIMSLARGGISNSVGLAVLRGLEDGFCGALTTVSTFALELRDTRIVEAYVYAGASIGSGVACWIVCAGSVFWVRGWS